VNHAEICHVDEIYAQPVPGAKDLESFEKNQSKQTRRPILTDLET
jgi:hypothetical protein